MQNKQHLWIWYHQSVIWNEKIGGRKKMKALACMLKVFYQGKGEGPKLVQKCWGYDKAQELGARIYHLWTRMFGPYNFNYRTHPIISRKLYNFYAIFHCSLYCRAVWYLIFYDSFNFCNKNRTDIAFSFTFLLYKIGSEVVNILVRHSVYYDLIAKHSASVECAKSSFGWSLDGEKRKKKESWSEVNSSWES